MPLKYQDGVADVHSDSHQSKNLMGNIHQGLDQEHS